MRLLLAILLLSSCAHRRYTAPGPVLEVTYWACESERRGVTHCRYTVEDGKTVDYRWLEVRVR